MISGAQELPSYYFSPIISMLFRDILSTRLARALQWQKLFAGRRLFSQSTIFGVKQMPPRPKIDESDVTGAYLKGSGPGGQKIVSVFFFFL